MADALIVVLAISRVPLLTNTEAFKSVNSNKNLKKKRDTLLANTPHLLHLWEMASMNPEDAIVIQVQEIKKNQLCSISNTHGIREG